MEELGEFYRLVIPIVVGMVILSVCAIQIRLDYNHLKKKYDDLKTSHDNLISDVKLLNQENFYLKQMLNINTDR